MQARIFLLRSRYLKYPSFTPVTKQFDTKIDIDVVFTGAPVKNTKLNKVTPVKNDVVAESSLPIQPKKIVDINESQTCKNKGCGKTFQEINNNENACEYHPGPAVFHDRVKGVRHGYPAPYFYLVCIFL